MALIISCVPHSLDSGMGALPISSSVRVESDSSLNIFRGRWKSDLYWRPSVKTYNAVPKSSQRELDLAPAYLTHSVFEVVLQKSTPPKIRQLFLHYYANKD